MTINADLHSLQLAVAAIVADGDQVDAADGVTIRVLDANPSASPAYAATTRPLNKPAEEIDFALRQVLHPDDFKITGDRTTRSFVFVINDGAEFIVLSRIPKV